VRVRSVSRWLNAVSVEASQAQVNSLARLPFVMNTRPVAALAHPRPQPGPALPAPLEKTISTTLAYGPSVVQLSNIRVTDLHALGITGHGVLVGMIDNGFNNHRSHVALKDIPVVGEYDFIHRITSTQRQPWERPSQGNHGAATLSALAGFEEGTLIGAAYGVSVMLAKTEMDSTEVPAEEDLYVEALEWMELSGADIVSTSLGYIDWYPYDSLDGNTAITTRAARVSASKGVLLVTAMGNETWYRKDSAGKPIPGLTGTLIAPADADSILAVGATHSDGEIASFSSTGPAADDRVKPDIVAQGVAVVAADGSTVNRFGSYNGTSLATPLVAGVAALILSAQPDLTPMQLREAILQTALQIEDPFDPSRTAIYPNNFYGHGMVNAYEALLYHGVGVSSQPTVVPTDSGVTVSFSIISDVALVPDSLVLMVQSAPSGPFQPVKLEPAGQNRYSVTLPLSSDSSYPRGYVRVRDTAGRARISPLNAPDSVFVFSQFIPVNAAPAEFRLHQNFPNPFNAGTWIWFDAPGVVDVEVDIFDLLGRHIKRIYRGLSAAGANTFRWDGDSDAGRAVSTGMYICRLQFANGALSQKMVLLR
ncbi:MAG TPA: S8 family peptidase, partial [Bacteroidota bacterium]